MVSRLDSVRTSSWGLAAGRFRDIAEAELRPHLPRSLEQVKEALEPLTEGARGGRLIGIFNNFH